MAHNQQVILHIGQGSTKISKINKNFVELKDSSINGIITTLNNDGSINIKGIANSSGNIGFLKENIILKANKSYTFSIKKVAGNNMSNSIWFWNMTDKNSEITLNLNNPIKTVKYNKDVILSALNMTINQGNNFDITLSIQVEEGIVETEHIKHEQENYILLIQQEMLTGDYFVKEEDGWKEVHAWKKYIFTGDEGFGSMENGVFYSSENLFSDAKLPNSNTIPAEIYCNCLKSESYNKTWEQQTDNSIALNADGTNNPRIYYSKIISATEFKNLLQQKYAEGNPIYAYYKTTTPTKLPCTEEQIAVLEELNNLELFSGTNNIITVEDIALLILKYIQQTNEKINNEGNVESRPILRLEKTVTDKVELTINNCRFKYNFNNEEYVEIDCEQKEVKYEGLNRNRQIEIGYEFPILNVGDNDIKMHSGDCVIKVLRKDRWL